ncbi:MAG: sulfite exporter TauE/SafE family protein [Halarchaeum sp.]
MTAPLVPPAELALFGAVGLLGGAHCLGMCGPLVTTYAERMPTDRRGPSTFELRQHALFNLGRTASYAVVGGLLGLVGATVYAGAGVALGGTADVVRGVAGVLAGLFVLAAGVGRVVGRDRLASLLPGSLGVGGAASALFSRVAGAATSRVDDYATSPKIVALGAIHAFLPCPLLYPAFVYALGQGEPVAGALDLAALGLGTIPAMFLFGTVLGSVPAARRAAAYRVLGVVLILLAFVPLLGGLELLGAPVAHVPIPHYTP